MHQEVRWQREGLSGGEDGIGRTVLCGGSLYEGLAKDAGLGAKQLRCGEARLTPRGSSPYEGLFAKASGSVRQLLVS